MARRFSLAWLKPPKVPPDGVMTLGEHLRELRYRLILSMLVIAVGTVVAWFYQDQLFELLFRPWNQAIEIISASNPNLDVQSVLRDVVTPLILVLKVCAVAALIGTSPIWLYQVWAFLAPALLAKEKKYALAFLGAAVPLFLAGVAVAYLILPQAIAFMMSFTPESLDVVNLIEMDAFLSLLLQLMVVFGLGFLMPVVLVALNLMGLLSAKSLKAARAYVIFGCFVFGAAATPGGDPFSMLALAVPMIVLFFVAEAICRVNDKRRNARLAAQGLLVEP